jgi:cytochrome c553
MHHTDQRFLLTMSTLDLCVDCHDEPEDLSERAHTVSEVERCTACHDPHFGSNALLKPNPTIEIPG